MKSRTSELQKVIYLCGYCAYCSGTRSEDDLREWHTLDETQEPAFIDGAHEFLATPRLGTAGA